MIKKIKDYIFGVREQEVKEKKLEPKGLTLEIYVVTLQDSSKFADSPYEVKNADYFYLIEAKKQIDEEIAKRAKDTKEWWARQSLKKEPSDESVQLEDDKLEKNAALADLGSGDFPFHEGERGKLLEKFKKEIEISPKSAAMAKPAAKKSQKGAPIKKRRSRGNKK